MNVSSRKGEEYMDDYQKRREQCWWQELKYIYPWLAPPDERTPEERRKDAERAQIELFGPEENEKGGNHDNQGPDRSTEAIQ